MNGDGEIFHYEREIIFEVDIIKYVRENIANNFRQLWEEGE